MAILFRSYDWEQSELGPMDQWPPELPSFVILMLASREVVTIFWGSNRLMIYDDAYITQLGPRHPMPEHTLREVWPDVVDQVEPFIEPVFREGRSSYLNNTALTVIVDRKQNVRFYIASFEPVWVRNNRSSAVWSLSISDQQNGRSRIAATASYVGGSDQGGPARQ